MSTTLVTCPDCGANVRVSVQPSRVSPWRIDKKVVQLSVQFDSQTAAHTCKEKKK